MVKTVTNSQELGGRARLKPTRSTQFATYGGTYMVLQIVNLSETNSAEYTAFTSTGNWQKTDTLAVNGQLVLPMNFGGTPLFVMNNSNPQASPANILVVLAGLQSSSQAADAETAEVAEDIETLASHSADLHEISTQIVNGTASLLSGQRTVFSTLSSFKSSLNAENAGDVAVTVKARLEQNGRSFSKTIAPGESDTVIPWTLLEGGLLDVSVDGDDSGAVNVTYETRHDSDS